MSEQEMMHDHPAEEIEAEEYEVEALAVEVSTQPIELYKVLKIANAVSGGGEAKFAIAEGYVAVNGELEQRKRCKLYDGDVVEFNQEFYVVIYQPEAEMSLEPTNSEYQALDDSENTVFDGEDLQSMSSTNSAANKGNKRNASDGKPAKKSKSGDKKANPKKKSSKKSKSNEKKEPIVRDQNTGRGGISF